MASNVEEIVLKAKDEASAVINRVSGQLGGLGDVLSRLAGLAGPVGISLAALGTALGSVGLAGTKLADTVEQLDLLAARTGVAIEQLQIFQQVIQEAGGSPESLNTALNFLNRAIATSDPLLKKLGIEGMNTFDTFMALSRIFAASGETANKAEVAYQLLGRGAAELIPLLPKLSTEFARMSDRAREAGTIIGEDVAEQARVLDEAMDMLSRNWRGAMTRIQADTVGPATIIINAFNDIWDAVTGRKKTALEKVERDIQDTMRAIAAESRRIADADFAGMPESVVARFDRKLEALENTLAQLQKARDAILNPPRLHDRPLTKEQAEDPLARRDLFDKANQAAEEYKKRLAELSAALKGTGLNAADVAKRLDEIANAAKRADILKTLGMDAVVGGNVEESKKFADEVQRAVETLGLDLPEALQLVSAKMRKLRQQAADELAESLGLMPDTSSLWAEKSLTAIEQVRIGWLETLAAITSEAGILDSVMNTAFQSIQTGFADSMQQIVAGTATAGRVLTTLWHSIVNAIIQELARIAAALVLTRLFSVFTGLFPSPFAGAFGGAGAVAGEAGTILGRNLRQAQGGVLQPAQTVNIYSYDLRDGVRELQSITGGQRAARAKVEYLGEY